MLPNPSHVRVTAFVVIPFVVAVSAFSIVPHRERAISLPLGNRPRIDTFYLRLNGPGKRITSDDNGGSDNARKRTFSALLAGLFGSNDPVKSYNNTTHISPTSDWQIYVDQSKASLDRGGGATFDAFFSLCDHDGEGGRANNEDVIGVQVIPAILPKPVGGGKAPWIRCLWNTNKKNIVRPSPNLDVSNVDSVDKVYRILTKHLGVKNVSQEACECLKWKYKGNTFLESGEIQSAIGAYNEALSICEDYAIAQSTSSNVDNQAASILQQQEGIILLLRASAYLQQAQSHKEILQTDVAGDEETKLPSSQVLQALFSDTLSPPPFSPLPEPDVPPGTSDVSDNNQKVGAMGNDLPEANGERAESAVGKEKESPRSSSTDRIADPPIDIDPQMASRLSMLRKLQRNGMFRDAQLRKLQYRHGLYQMSLLQAARDSLKATEVLPNYSTAWLRAAEILSDLWKIKESKQYYEKALSVDASLKESLVSVLSELEERQELLKRARASKDLSEDSLQLALDIAG